MAIKKSLILLVLGALAPLPGSADSLLDDGLRKIEQLRLLQLMTVQSNNDLAAFTTDGCSGNLSASWRLLSDHLPGFVDNFGAQPPWEHCCVSHDQSYWQGSAVDGYVSRLRADRVLRQCVVSTGDDLAPALARKHGLEEGRVRELFAVVADLMYRAVRFGGQPCTMLPWRWGYGWPYCAFADAAETSPQVTAEQ